MPVAPRIQQRAVLLSPSATKPFVDGGLAGVDAYAWIVFEIACYLVRVPLLGELADDERAKLVTVLNLLALVLGVFAPNVGFLLRASGDISPILVAIAL